MTAVLPNALVEQQRLALENQEEIIRQDAAVSDALAKQQQLEQENQEEIVGRDPAVQDAFEKHETFCHHRYKEAEELNHSFYSRLQAK